MPFSSHPTTALIWAQDANALMFFSEYEKLKERTAYRGRYEDDGEQYGGIDEQAILNYLDDETSIVYTSMQGNQMHQLCVSTGSYIAQSNTIDINKFKLNQKLIELAMTGTHAPNMVADTQFPVDAAHRLYTDLFSGLTECLYGRKSFVYQVMTLEISRSQP